MTLTITAEPAKGYIPLTVIFSHTSSLTPSSYAWDFGDGNISEEAAPVHTYETPGTYTVSLKITDAYSVSETASATITVEEPTAPAVSISADITKAYAPQTIRFECEVSGGIPDDYRYAWDFGDGNISDEPNPEYRYSAAGTYTAKLTVSTNGGMIRTESQPLTIIIIEATYPNIILKTEQTGQFTIKISNLTEHPDIQPSAISWDFGDGTSAEAFQVYKTYDSPGTYSILCKASNDNGDRYSGYTLEITEAEERGLLDGYGSEVLLLLMSSGLFVAYLMVGKPPINGRGDA